MTVSQSYTDLSPEAYLEAEKLSPIKHEYIQGQAYAMASTSIAQATIVANLLTLVRTHIRGGPCRVFAADVKVRVEAANAFYYPDLLVTCAAEDANAESVIRQPTLLVEVLARTPEGFDRGEKFAHYRPPNSLQEYLLISSERLRVECFRLNPEGNWVLYAYTEADRLHLTSLDFHCPISALYEDVSLSNPAPILPDL